MIENGVEMLTEAQWKRKNRAIKPGVQGVVYRNKAYFAESDTVIACVRYPWEYREKYSEDVQTALNWLKKGRLIKDGVEGIELAPNRNCYQGSSAYPTRIYYPESATIENPVVAKAKIKEIRRIQSALYRDEKKRREEEEKRRIESLWEAIEYWNSCHTAWQWISRGFVPKSDAKWFYGIEGYGKSLDYYYCHIDDVIKDQEQADRLLIVYDHMMEGVELPPPLEMYNGKPWWK